MFMVGIGAHTWKQAQTPYMLVITEICRHIWRKNKGVVITRQEIFQALTDLYIYYQAAPENNNIKAAKQALKEILNLNTLEVKKYEKSNSDSVMES